MATTHHVTVRGLSPHGMVYVREWTDIPIFALSWGIADHHFTDQLPALDIQPFSKGGKVQQSPKRGPVTKKTRGRQELKRQSHLIHPHVSVTSKPTALYVALHLIQNSALFFHSSLKQVPDVYLSTMRQGCEWRQNEGTISSIAAFGNGKCLSGRVVVCGWEFLSEYILFGDVPCTCI